MQTCYIERMLKAGAQSPSRPEGPDPAERSTKNRIVEAAIETLKRRGFAGASARAIAVQGGFNQALIFYHFGTLHRLLLAALDRTSAERLQSYRRAVASAGSLEDLLDVAAAVYAEDLRSGHIKVLAEMIAGASSAPELGPEIVRRVEPWIDFAAAQIGRALKGSGVEGIVPARDAAYALVAQYLGIELLSHLQGDTAAADSLFNVAGNIGRLLGPMLQLGAAMGEADGRE
jgi:AcrR family transcriptional regulator